MTLVLKLALLVTILINSLVSSEIKCPNKCKCMDTVVRCMFAQLDKVPSVPLDTTVLDLRFNKIQHIGVNAFKRLKNLNTLLLNNNHVNHLKNGVFNGLTGLKYLYLYKNRIKEIDSDALHPLENLEQLYLHFNKIESLPKGVFRSLKKLNRLFLHNNKLQRIPSEAFQNLHEIKRLRLDSNALICDCQLIWLAKMLQDKRQETQSAVTCHDPAPMQGKPVTHLLEDEGFHCSLTTEKPESENIIDTDEIKSKEGRCEKERQTCETLRCPYGVERYYVAETGCEDCRCHNPCRDHQCEDGMRCAPELYRGEGGETAVRASCRLGFSIDSANQEHNKLSIIGENTRPVDPENKYPWMAALMTVVGNSEEQFCGGSVVHERHVVTAAHCVKDIDPVDPPRNRIFVRLGEYQLSIRTVNEQDFKVDKIMIHERYFNNISSGDNNNTCDRHYDIAILRLSQPADLEYFPRIYLPMDEETSGIDGEKATVIGWGITDIERYKTIYNTSDILLQNEVHIMTSENCKRHYYWYERAMMICTKPTAGDN